MSKVSPLWIRWFRVTLKTIMSQARAIVTDPSYAIKGLTPAPSQEHWPNIYIHDGHTRPYDIASHQRYVADLAASKSMSSSHAEPEPAIPQESSEVEAVD
jgi:hypothetical protein